MSLGIVGFGVVGQALLTSVKEEYLKSVMIFDKSSKRYNSLQESISDAIRCEVLFICVDTPSTTNGQDASNIKDVLDTLQRNNYIGLIIIKSTVLYNNIKPYLNDKLQIVYNPEFLNANSSNNDFYEQNYIVLGGDTDLTMRAMYFYENYFGFLYDPIEYEFCTIKEAIDFKYTRNLYQAYKVLFWEFIQENTGNARKMSKLLSKLPMDENSQVGMDGYHGFGGACLPKDLQAKLFDDNEQHPTLKYMSEYNKKLLERNK